MWFFKKKVTPTVPTVITSNKNIQEERESRPISTYSKLSHQSVGVPIDERVTITRKVNCCRRCCTKKTLKEQALLMTTIAAVILGIIIGVVLRNLKCSTGERINGCRITKEEITYIDFPGQIFINILKMLILPLIVSSIITSLAQLDAQAAGKMGVRALVYYLATTLIAAIIGIILVLSIRPGLRGGTVQIKPDSKTAEGRTVDTVLDLFRNLFPDNIMEATFRSFATDLKVNRTLISGPNATNEYKTIYKATVVKRDGINVLGLLLFCIVFGILISRLKEKAKILRDFFEAMLAVVMLLVRIAMLYSPIGIFFLITAKILDMDDLRDFLGSLGLYMATVLVGLFIHGFIILPLILYVITRMNSFKYIRGMSQALVTAFGTASSSATLPVTFRCVEEKNHIDPRVSRFVLPVGATVNMDGTALYEAVAAIYIAQLNGIPLDAVKIIVTSFTATLASIGAASIPQAGLVTMVIVLNALGLPAEEVKTIYAVDWLLDRFRTAINVFGDSIGCAIVEHLSRKELDADANINGTDTAMQTLVSTDTECGTGTPNGIVIRPPNHIPPTTYNNPTFANSSEANNNDKDNNMDKTNF
ncbi:unnamed protein product [Rotaria sp. Silwood2]|nr:unnamed protein product [Rotaria sp. Silwood2]CAF2587662.1 unnamed protein product [Rotaria sp. Silwood2]CAF2999555.1 unnamed protein product [Rotaria sp. Silwood2]CAF4012811.1 unnamed protein product [Rotaria sp. Silwood2]CAF4048036.1 unnamed protein product [Rotaria sp. Silwood2]